MRASSDLMKQAENETLSKAGLLATCIYVHVYVYIYIYRGRERKREWLYFNVAAGRVALFTIPNDDINTTVKRNLC
jgi:hypothetical protein